MSSPNVLEPQTTAKPSSIPVPTTTKPTTATDVNATNVPVPTTAKPTTAKPTTTTDVTAQTAAVATTDVNAQTTVEPTTASSSCSDQHGAVCQVLIPVAAVVLVASIVVPKLRDGCFDSEEEEEEKEKETEKEEEKGFNIVVFSKQLLRKVMNALNLNKSESLSDDESFTASEYVKSESN